MISTALAREFERVRLSLCRAGVPVHVPWSLSVADGSTLVITPHDAGSGPLAFGDLVSTTLHYADGRAARAAGEVGLHRAMYARGRHRAVLVCRPPYAMTLAAMQPSVKVGARTIPVIEAAALGQHPRRFAADEVVLLKGCCAIAGAVDPQACLDAVLRLESACQDALPGASRPGPQ